MIFVFGSILSLIGTAYIYYFAIYRLKYKLYVPYALSLKNVQFQVLLNKFRLHIIML